MNEFVYSYPTKIYFGEGSASKYLPMELEKVGDVVMLAYGGGSIKNNGIYDEISTILKDAGKKVVDFKGIMPNPTYKKVLEGAALAKKEKVDFILAVGGGSVSDCCKIVACAAMYEEDIWDMEFVDNKLPQRALPLGVVVTVSGTGSEQNSGAVITNEEKNLKSALWGAHADFAILDPSYTLSVPFEQVISGAFDTLSHAMETYFGKPQEIFISDEINEAVMRNTIRNIREVIKNPDNINIDYNKKIYVAPRQEINLGDAIILSNIDGKLKEYSVEIQRIYLNNNYDNKSMVIKIKDENLINKTGGIVQGMSGSPIIQNGKFIGAITHVFVKDPTLGYAVFADRMISELHT